MTDLQTKNDFKNAIKEVLEETGLISPDMRRQEIIHQIGRHRYEKAVKAGHIHRNKKGGKSATVRVKRAEFIELLNQGKI